MKNFEELHTEIEEHTCGFDAGDTCCPICFREGKELGYTQAKQEVLGEVMKIIEENIEFHKKEVIKHFESNKKKSSKLQVKKEVNHKYCLYQFEELLKKLEELGK